MSDGGRSVVGCVATAMAQIMGYHQWPEKGTGTIPGYTTRSQGLVIDEENIENTYYDWDHMTPAPGEELQVPVADLQAGTYLLRVRTAQEVKTTPIYQEIETL